MTSAIAMFSVMSRSSSSGGSGTTIITTIGTTPMATPSLA